MSFSWRASQPPLSLPLCCSLSSLARSLTPPSRSRPRVNRSLVVAPVVPTPPPPCLTPTCSNTLSSATRVRSENTPSLTLSLSVSVSSLTRSLASAAQHRLSPRPLLLLLLRVAHVAVVLLFGAPGVVLPRRCWRVAGLRHYSVRATLPLSSSRCLPDYSYATDLRPAVRPSTTLARGSRMPVSIPTPT